MTGAITRSFRILWEAIDRFNRNDGSAMAGFIAFSGLLSIFPFLIFAATLTGILIGEGQSARIIDALFDIAPEHVARTLEPVISEVLGKRSQEILTLSAVFAIWVASNAVEAFRIAFDRAYAVEDPRGFLRNRAMAILIVFVGAIVAALLGLSILLSPLILRIASEIGQVPIPAAAAYTTHFFGMLVFVAFLLLMHRMLPAGTQGARRLWPGILVTTLLWMLAAWAFSAYLGATPSYTVTYGTLAGVIITLMFFYLTGAVIIFGAEVNAALQRRGAPVGEPVRENE